jgi:aspartokinase
MRMFVLSAAATLAFGGTSLAQTPAAPPAAPPQTPAAPAAPQAAVVTDSELQKMAEVTPELIRISEAAEPKIAAAEDAEARAEVEREVVEELARTVEAHGLTPQRYNEIAMLAQRDPEIAARIIGAGETSED